MIIFAETLKYVKQLLHIVFQKRCVFAQLTCLHNAFFVFESEIIGFSC